MKFFQLSSLQVLAGAVWAEEDEEGMFDLVGEDKKLLLINVDQKAHKSNERADW